MPDGLQLMVPTKLVPLIATRLLSWPTKLRMGMELFHPPGRHPEDQSVAEFIRRWLENEGRWRQGKFTAINVKFASEPVAPSSPTLHLDFQQNNTEAAP